MDAQEVVQDIMNYLVDTVGYDGHHEISGEIKEIVDDLLCKITNHVAAIPFCENGVEMERVPDRHISYQNCELPPCSVYDSISKGDTMNPLCQQSLLGTSNSDNDAIEHNHLLTLRDCGILNILSRPDYIKPLNLLKQTDAAVPNEKHVAVPVGRSIKTPENIFKLQKDQNKICHEINSTEILETVKLWLNELLEINFVEEVAEVDFENKKTDTDTGTCNSTTSDGIGTKLDSDLFDTDIAKVTEDWTDDQMECEIKMAPGTGRSTEIDATNYAVDCVPVMFQNTPYCESKSKSITADKAVSLTLLTEHSKNFDQHFISASKAIVNIDNTPDIGCSILPIVRLNSSYQACQELGVCQGNTATSTSANTSSFQNYSTAGTTTITENPTESPKSVICSNESVRNQYLLELGPELHICDSKQSDVSPKELVCETATGTNKKLSTDFVTSLINEVVDKTLSNIDQALVVVDEKFSQDFDSMLSMTNSQIQDGLLVQQQHTSNDDKALDSTPNYNKIDVCSQLSYRDLNHKTNLDSEIKTEPSQNSVVVPIVKRQLNFSNRSEEKTTATDKLNEDDVTGMCIGDTNCKPPEDVLTVERSVDSNITLVELEQSILESHMEITTVANSHKEANIVHDISIEMPDITTNSHVDSNTHGVQVDVTSQIHTSSKPPLLPLTTSNDPVVSSSPAATVTFDTLPNSPNHPVTHVACTGESKPQSTFQIPVEIEGVEYDKENMTSKKMDCKTLKRQVQAIEQQIVDKEETLRKLQLVKIHSQKVNLQEMTELVHKWKKVCKASLIELQKVAVMPDGSSPTMNLLLGHFNIDPQILT